MTQYRLKKETFGIPAGTTPEHDGTYYHLNYRNRRIVLPEGAVRNSDEFEKVEELAEWEKRFDAAYNYPPSEQVRRLKDFMLDEYLIMGEEIMELSNNQTNRAFCDDVMQVMRERGAIK